MNCHFGREQTSLILGDRIFVSVKTAVQNMGKRSDDAFQIVFRNERETKS
jgi:ribosomal protein L14